MQGLAARASLEQSLFKEGFSPYSADGFRIYDHPGRATVEETRRNVKERRLVCLMNIYFMPNIQVANLHASHTRRANSRPGMKPYYRCGCGLKTRLPSTICQVATAGMLSIRSRARRASKNAIAAEADTERLYVLPNPVAIFYPLNPSLSAILDAFLSIGQFRSDKR